MTRAYACRHASPLRHVVRVLAGSDKSRTMSNDFHGLGQKY
jgi:hypothetical protein